MPGVNYTSIKVITVIIFIFIKKWYRMYTPLISIDPRKCKEVCKRSVFPVDSDSKEYTCKAKDLGLSPGWGRSSGEGNGYPLQYSCLENPMDRGTWWATVYGVAKSWKQLSNTHTHTHTQYSIPHLYSFICWWHLGYFHVLTIVNNAATNIEVNTFFSN